jgi:hypothetical protein
MAVDSFFLKTMQTQELLDRYEYATKCQKNEIDRLRAELERRDEELTQLLAWINGDSDALVTLQRTYMDPRTSTSDRIKAAGAAIAYERPKLSVQVRVGPAVLSERLARGKEKRPAHIRTTFPRSETASFVGKARLISQSQDRNLIHDKRLSMGPMDAERIWRLNPNVCLKTASFVDENWYQASGHQRAG